MIEVKFRMAAFVTLGAILISVLISDPVLNHLLAGLALVAGSFTLHFISKLQNLKNGTYRKTENH